MLKMRIKKLKKSYSKTIEQKIEIVLHNALNSKKLQSVHKEFILNFPKWNTNLGKNKDIIKVAIAKHRDQLIGLPDSVFDPQIIQEVPQINDTETRYTSRLIDTDYVNTHQHILDIEKNNIYSYTVFNKFQNLVESVLNTIIEMWIKSNIELHEFYSPDRKLCNKLIDCGIQLDSSEIEWLSGAGDAKNVPQSLISLWYTRSHSVNEYYNIMHEHLHKVQKILPYTIDISELAIQLDKNQQVKNYILCKNYIEFINTLQDAKSQISIEIRRRDIWYKYIKNIFSEYSIKLNTEPSEQMTVFLTLVYNFIVKSERQLLNQNEIIMLVAKMDAARHNSVITTSEINKLTIPVKSKIIDIIDSIPRLTDILEKNAEISQETINILIQDNELDSWNLKDNSGVYDRIQEYRIDKLSQELGIIKETPEKYFPWYMMTRFFKTDIEKIPNGATRDIISTIINHEQIKDNHDLSEIITFVALNKKFGGNRDYLEILSRIDNIPSPIYELDLNGRSSKEISEIINNLGITVLTKYSYELYTKIYNCV